MRLVTVQEKNVHGNSSSTKRKGGLLTRRLNRPAANRSAFAKRWKCRMRENACFMGRSGEENKVCIVPDFKVPTVRQFRTHFPLRTIKNNRGLPAASDLYNRISMSKTAPAAKRTVPPNALSSTNSSTTPTITRAIRSSVKMIRSGASSNPALFRESA